MKIEDRLNDTEVKVINYADYKGGMILDDTSCKFFDDLDSIKDYYNALNKEIPQYVYGTRFKSIKINLTEILEEAYENVTDDITNFIESRVNGVEELQAAINKFNEINKEIGNYYWDWNTIVELR